MNRFKHLSFLVIPILFVLLALSAGSSLAQETNAPDAVCNPSSTQVAVYDKTNYNALYPITGKCRVYPVGAAIPNTPFIVRSVKVGGNVRALLYRGANYTVQTNIYFSNNPNVPGSLSLRVDWRPQPSGCVPGPYQIALFVNQNYGGQCILKEIGDYPDWYEIGLQNDSIESVKVGQYVRTTLLQHSQWHDPTGGLWSTFVNNDPNLGNDRIRNNQVSWAKVKLEPCPISTTQAALYANYHYEGQCKVLGLGNYPSLPAAGFPNDVASSVDVGANVKLTLYQHVNYGGTSTTFLTPDQYLADNAIGDNAASSAKVQNR